MNEGMEDVKHSPLPGGRVLLLHPWRKRNVYTEPGRNPNMFSYPIHPNSVRVGPKGTPMRLVRYAPLPPPHFVRPGYSNQRFLPRPPYPMPQMMPMYQSNSSGAQTPPQPRQLLSPSMEKFRMEIPQSLDFPEQMIQHTSFQEHSMNQQVQPLNFNGSQFQESPTQSQSQPLDFSGSQFEQLHSSHFNEPETSPMVQPDFHDLQNDQMMFQHPHFQPSPVEKLMQESNFTADSEFMLPFGEDICSNGNIVQETLTGKDPQDSVQKNQQLLTEEAELKYNPSAQQTSPLKNTEYQVQAEVTPIMLPEVAKEEECRDLDGRVGFNSIEEALMALDGPSSSPEEPSPAISPILLNDPTTPLKIKMGPKVHNEVVKAAKSLFSKRTRTLYHWLYPETSKTKLKATVTSAWDTLPENEKLFYMSQVLGRFGLQAGSLMINPQLDGIKGFSSDNQLGNPDGTSVGNKEGAVDAEAERAVEDLFASCKDSDCWVSYPRSKSRSAGERRRKRKSEIGCERESGSTLLSQAVEYCTPTDDPVSSTPKRVRDSAKYEVDFEEDVELQSELDKFRLFADSEELLPEEEKVEDDVWRRSPKTMELFEQLGI